MSGAEVLLVIGIIANVEALVDGSLKVINRVVSFCHDTSELPNVLQQVQVRLPLLMIALKKRSDESVLSKLDIAERKALLDVLMQIKSKAEKLEAILSGLCPADDASKWTKGWRAISSLRQDKKIQEIVEEMKEDMQYLVFNDFQVPGLQPVYATVEAELETIPAEPRKPLFMVDVWRDDKFIGRSDVIAHMNKILSHNRIALVALGGMGKTRIALEYALKYKESLDVSVFWIHASTAARISDAFGHIARKANIAAFDDPQNGGMKAVKAWLESESCGKWLIIIDNADDVDMLYGPDRLADFFPRSDKGSMIMTTRDRRVGVNFTGSLSKVILLEALTESHSMELLASKFEDETSVEDFKELAKELEGIPLALVQAAAYIQGNWIKIDDYLNMYRESLSSQIELLSEDFEDIIRDSDSKNPVAATWAISFDYIAQNTPLAADILKKMCLLDSQAIPISLLNGEERQSEFVKAIGTLQSFCLIMVRSTETRPHGTKEKTFDLHRLVRLAMRNWLRIHDQLYVWTAKTLKMLAARYPNLSETPWVNMDKWTAYLPHAVALLSSPELIMAGEDTIPTLLVAQKMISDHSEDEYVCGVCAATLMINVSFSFETQNNAASKFWAMRQLSLRKFILGEHHVDTIESMIQAANAQYRCGDLVQAQRLGERAIKIIETTDQPPTMIATGLEVRGIILTEHGELKEAEKCHLESLRTRREILGPDHLVTVRSIEYLAGVWTIGLRDKDAEELLLDALKIRMKISGPQSPDTLIVMSLLSSLYYRLGRYEEALELNMQVSTVRATILGPKHPDTIKTMSNLAAVYYGRDEFVEGIKLGLKALDLSNEVLGQDDPSTINLLLNLNSSFEKQGRREEAVSFLSQAHEAIYRRVKSIGVQDPETSRLMKNLASTYEGEGRFQKAEPLRIDLVRSRIKSFGEDSPAAVTSMLDLAVNYNNQGRYELAAMYQLDALKQQTKSLGPENSETIFRMASVGVEWANANRSIEAETITRDAVALARKVLVPSDPTYRYALSNLAAVCSNATKYEEAEKLYRLILQSQETETRSQEEDFKVFDIAQTKIDLAAVLINRVRYREAKEMADEAEDLLIQAERMKPSRNKGSVIPNDSGRDSLRGMPASRRSLPYAIRSMQATVCTAMGSHSEATALFSEVLEAQMKKWRPEDATLPETRAILTTLENMAGIYGRCEKYAKAENLYRHTLRIRTETQGPRNIETLTTKCFVAGMLNYRQRFEEALSQYRMAKVFYQGLGIDTPATKIAMANIDCGMAKSYLGLGRLGDAKFHSEVAVEIHKQFLDERNLHLLFCREVLAASYTKMGGAWLSEAAKIEERAVKLWSEGGGAKHLRTLKAMESLATIYRKQSRDEEAVELEVKVRNLKKEVDFGLEEQREKEVDDLIFMVLSEWANHQDVILQSLGDLSIGKLLPKT